MFFLWISTETKNAFTPTAFWVLKVCLAGGCTDLIDSCKFQAEEIVGAKNFNFVSQIYSKLWLWFSNFAFLRKKILARRYSNNSLRAENLGSGKQLPLAVLPPCYDTYTWSGKNKYLYRNCCSLCCSPRYEKFCNLAYVIADLMSYTKSVTSRFHETSGGMLICMQNRNEWDDISWWCSIVVRKSVLAGELSLSCARLMDGCLTTLWLKRPLSVNQQGQLSLPSLRGRLNE